MGIDQVIFLVAIGGFFLLFFSVIRWAKKRDKQLAMAEKTNAVVRESRARALGWRYDPTHDGDVRYRFAGSTAQAHIWELRYDSDASSSSSTPKLIWEIASLRVMQTSFEISQGKAFELMQGSGARKVTSVAASIAWAVGSATAQDVISFYRDAKVQQLGSVSFRNKWKVMARNLADVSRLLDAETEDLLLNWPKTVERQFDPLGSVVVTRGPQGLRIECRYDATDMPLFGHIVKLGEAIAARVSAPGC
jgi:hypothetical protein